MSANGIFVESPPVQISVVAKALEGERWDGGGDGGGEGQHETTEDKGGYVP